MNRHHLALLLFLLTTGTSSGKSSADKLLEEAEFRGGIIVHLDANGSQLSVDLAKARNAQLHALERSAKALTASRNLLFEKADYGQGSAAQYDGEHLPYVDNLINLIVCEKKTSVPEAEILRVLRPLGTAIIDGKKTVKPWPKDIDEWNHFLHGPDNNAVAHDKRVNQPRSMQWVTEP